MAATSGPKTVFSDTKPVVEFGKCAVDFGVVCCAKIGKLVPLFKMSSGLGFFVPLTWGLISS